MSVVRNRRDQLQLFVHGRDAGSATLPKLRTFPVGGVVSSYVENVSKAIQDRVLRAFFTSRDKIKLKISCHCGLR